MKSEGDWLTLTLPEPMIPKELLERSTFASGRAPGLQKLDAVLLGIAEGVFHDVPFDLALIGEETAGLISASSVTDDDLRRGGILLAPKTRERFKQLPPSHALAHGLSYFPFP